MAKRASKAGSKPVAAPDYRFQVVIQFPESHFAKLAEVLDFEQKLIASLPRTHEVDGYDVGMGTVNFFVLTNTPMAVFRNFRKYLGIRKVEKQVRIAYRDMNSDEFVNLWPKRDTRVFDYSY
jgi:hypothetical protein